ncbi:MAG: hypothetical protein U0524_01055 [Candidatus Saccharimonadales bacterium]
MTPNHEQDPDPNRGLWQLSTKEKWMVAATVAAILVAMAGVEVADGAFAEQPPQHSTPVK